MQIISELRVQHKFQQQIHFNVFYLIIKCDHLLFWGTLINYLFIYYGTCHILSCFHYSHTCSFFLKGKSYSYLSLLPIFISLPMWSLIEYNVFFLLKQMLTNHTHACFSTCFSNSTLTPTATKENYLISLQFVPPLFCP